VCRNLKLLIFLVSGLFGYNYIGSCVGLFSHITRFFWFADHGCYSQTIDWSWN